MMQFTEFEGGHGRTLDRHFADKPSRYGIRFHGRLRLGMASALTIASRFLAHPRQLLPEGSGLALASHISSVDLQGRRMRTIP